MSSKSKIIIGTLIFFAFILSASHFLGFRTEIIIYLGVMVFVLELALLDPPQRHKEFSPKDLRKSVNHLKGQNIGVPESNKIGSEYINEKINKDVADNK